MSKIILPSQQVPVDMALDVEESDGVDPVWYEKLSELTAFANLFSEVNFSAMTTGEVLVWDATLQKFVTGSN